MPTPDIPKPLGPFDPKANAIWQRAIAWMARAFWIRSTTYKPVSDLTVQLSVLDGRLHDARYTTLVAEESTLSDVEDLLDAVSAYPRHIKTASILARAAFAYYRERGRPLSLPRNVMPNAERADVQRVIE